MLRGDCLAVLADMEPESVDSIVTDPPYEIGFMGRAWDATGIAYDPETWAACLRVLKPGGHLLSFGATRTYHGIASAIERAGFEIRDCLSWLYGSGFPKSLDVSKAIDKARNDRPDVLRVTSFLSAAAEAAAISRADVDAHMGTSDMGGWWLSRLEHRCACPTWDQWLRLKALTRADDSMDAEVWRLNGRKGTPGHERSDRVVSEAADNAVFQPTQRVEFAGTPVLEDAERWQGWGTALKPAWEPIVLARKPLAGTVAANVLRHGTGALNVDGCRVGGGGQLKWSEPRDMGYHGGTDSDAEATANALGRWPANVTLDAEAAAMLDEQTDDEGGASRFFYVAKPSTAERSAGLDGFTAEFAPTMGNGIGGKEHDPETATAKRNVHPTVKPIELMRWLCRLVTPPGGVVLDPFTGSGTTGCAAVLEGFDFTGCEMSDDYADIAEARIAWWAKHAGEGTVHELLDAGRERDATADVGQVSIFDMEV